MIALAPFSLRSKVGRSDPDPAPELLACELRRRLQGAPSHVNVDPDLAAFVIEEASLAKDVSLGLAHAAHDNWLLIKAVGYLYGPVFGISFTQNCWGPMNRWYYYLWYPSSHYRPGIGWAVVTLDGKTDLVWCKFTSETSP